MEARLKDVTGSLRPLGLSRKLAIIRELPLEDVS
jgi:hypothetical protein